MLLATLGLIGLLDELDVAELEQTAAERTRSGVGRQRR
jgi:hypothetical protein